VSGPDAVARTRLRRANLAAAVLHAVQAVAVLVAGVVPWVAITVYLLSPGSTSSASAPGFVHGIFVSLFVFFNVFALNQWLQYRAVGRWRDYLLGERVYIVLSLTAKSALARQVFGGTLAS